LKKAREVRGARFIESEGSGEDNNLGFKRV
jgi:hypothetical protein